MKRTRIDQLDIRVSSLEQRVIETTTNVNNLIAEMRDFKTEMRDRDNQRAQEIMEMRRKHDADVKELHDKIDSKFDKLSGQLHSMTVATIVGFGAILVAVGGLIITVLK